MREVVLDTETTGLDARGGDRIVEIGCVELVNYIPSGRTWHSYLNPERDVPEAAYRVHGLSSDFLKDKPRFAELADELLGFIDGAQVVIHNAEFDLGFLNAELGRIERPPMASERVVCTLTLARRKHPGSPNNLDALCRRYQIDLSERGKHGALVDCRLLAMVYVELTGRRQAHLELAVGAGFAVGVEPGGAALPARPQPLAPRLTPEEAAAHEAFIEGLGAGALWRRYATGTPS